MARLISRSILVLMMLFATNICYAASPYDFLRGGSGQAWMKELSDWLMFGQDVNGHTKDNDVNITGGDIVGITPLAVADGGTGSSTVSGALTNLGISSYIITMIKDANATDTGYLTSTDWIRFDGKEIVLSFDWPLVRDQNYISISKADANTNGFLDGNDFAVFDNARSRVDSNQYIWNNAKSRLDLNDVIWTNAASRLDANQILWDNAVSRLDVNEATWDKASADVDANHITWDNMVSAEVDPCFVLWHASLGTDPNAEVDPCYVLWYSTFDNNETDPCHLIWVSEQFDPNHLAWDNAVTRLDANQIKWDNDSTRLDANQVAWDKSASDVDANHTVWDGKENVLTFNSPIIRTGNVVDLNFPASTNPASVKWTIDTNPDANVFGSDANLLGTPAGWIDVNVGGTIYVSPYYTKQ